MKRLILVIICLSLLTSGVIKNVPKNISQKKFNKFKKKYGEKAVKRVLLWDKLLEEAKNKDTLYKLKMVNDFFNKMKYQTDFAHWNKRNYWASPFEFLGTGAGDCEDYAIAKYFTLRQLGIEDKKLRITYVKLIRHKRKGVTYREAHMVLTYYHKPNSTPIVLDNVNKKLKLATNRKDLKPVYSFNANGLWRAQNKGFEKIGSNNMKSWKDLMGRF